MDEEVIQRVIYIVIVAVILIVNFVIRTKKKQMQAAQQQQQQQTVSETYHEMPEPPNPVSLETESYETIVPEEKAMSMKSHMHSSLISKIGQTKKNVSEVENIPNMHSSLISKTGQNKKSVPEVEHIPIKISPEELKKAVIYSEILSRREY